jgi:hypothetical protein
MDLPTVASYTIDLERDEPSRWADCIAVERSVALGLAQEAGAELERVPEVLRWVFAWLYRASGGLYRGEMRAWAQAIGVSEGTIVLLNCAYELSHKRIPKVLGCTAGVRWVEGLGMVHVRTLDWPLAGMADATRVFCFRRQAREFLTVGIPGQVGVLSGMLPGAYSVSINWAPPGARPSFDFGPAFLLREVLETCDDFEQAVATLESTQLATSAFFTVCGTRQGQACVIERIQRDAVVRPMTGMPLVQANHHVSDPFLQHNDSLHELEEGEDEPFFEDSGKRERQLTAKLAELPAACALEDLAAILDAPPILNKYTCQRMVFCPTARTVRVWCH